MAQNIDKKQPLNRNNVSVGDPFPIKVLQFGEGNFLRAFVEYAFQKLNQAVDFNAGIAVVQPIDRGMVSMLNDQDGLYTLFLKGLRKGQVIDQSELITNIVKGIDPYTQYDAYLALARESSLQFIISNTTEAGIAYQADDRADMKPPTSFPAKLTRFLWERFGHFSGDPEKGLTIIPCELINYNADTLKKIILDYCNDWELGDGFKTWINTACTFHNTLVDRIVPGYPKDDIDSYLAELDYHDNLVVTAEAFFLWVIEGGADLKAKLPFDKTELDVKIVEDMQPYRTRKVRILNGAHTTMVPFSLLYGNTTVKETVDNEFTGDFVNKAIFDEIIETLDMDKTELQEFAHEVLDRFRNPFIKHQLADIALNSISKFKVRVLPSLLEYAQRKSALPAHLTFAFACLIRFYRGTWNGATLPVKDGADIVAYFENAWKENDYDKLVENVLGQVAFWDEDLNQVPNLSKSVATALKEIEEHGVEKGFKNFKESL